MSGAHDGGTAFPVLELNKVTGDVCAQHLGMTLRDYFAAKAMQGYCAVESGWSEPADAVARCSYAMADAMLAERAK